jgi:hypothetical protein
MEMKIRRLSILTGLSILCVSILGSCSIIGLSIGAGIDRSERDEIFIDMEKLHELRKGQRINVYFHNGSSDKYRFRKIEVMLDGDYQVQYIKTRTDYKDSILLPVYGDTLNTIVHYFDVNHDLPMVDTLQGRFMGFDFNGISLHNADTVINLSLIRLFHLEDKSGNTYLLNEIHSLHEMGKLPFKSRMLVSFKQHKTIIYLEDIDRISIYNVKSKRKLIGFGAGLAADITIVAIILIALAFSDFYVGVP